MTVAAALLSELAAALETEPALARRLRSALGLEAAPNAEALIGPTEAGLTSREWRAAVRSGALRASRVGRRYLATRADVSAYVEARRVAPATAPARSKPANPASNAVARAMARGHLRSVPGGVR